MKAPYPFTFAITALLFSVIGTPDDTQAAPPEKDRKAILAMSGEYRVSFDFEETVSLQPGYELKEPYHEEATELVIVVEDTPQRIALQHILAVGGGRRVVKHWKQIWTWEDTRIIEFQGRDQWKVQELSPEEVSGTWSQLVTQVDDSPRYESFGKWQHDGGYSRWQSEVTARPLPRREHTKRDDYQVLLAVNRHALTPDGWVHEQDNLKQVVDENGQAIKYIAREIGVNRYTKTDTADFTKAKEYWESTRQFWGDVSSFWDEVEKTRDHYSIVEEIDGKSLMDEVNNIAKVLAKTGKPEPEGKPVQQVIEPFLN
ncbi:MAG: hypothetical protein CMO55_21905 [Verrucomicrobiales bacterium]|nr:hypothetical protein [Verrucomicrobiales bacterium]